MTTLVSKPIDQLRAFFAGPEERDGAAHAGPKPLWSPYAAGILLGVVLFAAFFVMGRGLGASGAMNRVMAALYELANADFAHGLTYYREYFVGDGSVLYDYALFQLLGVLLGGYTSAAFARRSRLMLEKGPRIGAGGRLTYAFAGGFVMAWGARIARGCTSGQVLTGSANLAVGSLTMFVMFFAGAYITAYAVRKQWT
ncbi:MAG: YeeE/YedE family protein [Candidatus Lambdaproteobacteria bacterium]|nr:YeeE/YedE family protein [Candidatus Lambdaproteobacteria bacterium]